MILGSRSSWTSSTTTLAGRTWHCGSTTAGTKPAWTATGNRRISLESTATRTGGTGPATATDPTMAGPKSATTLPGTCGCGCRTTGSTGCDLTLPRSSATSTGTATRRTTCPTDGGCCGASTKRPTPA